MKPGICCDCSSCGHANADGLCKSLFRALVFRGKGCLWGDIIPVRKK